MVIDGVRRDGGCRKWDMRDSSDVGKGCCEGKGWLGRLVRGNGGGG